MEQSMPFQVNRPRDVQGDEWQGVKEDWQKSGQNSVHSMNDDYQGVTEQTPMMKTEHSRASGNFKIKMCIFIN